MHSISSISFFLNYFCTGQVQASVAFHAFTLRALFGSTVGPQNLRISFWKYSAFVPWGHWKPWAGSERMWSVHQEERTSLPSTLPQPCLSAGATPSAWLSLPPLHLASTFWCVFLLSSFLKNNFLEIKFTYQTIHLFVVYGSIVF